MCFFVLSVGFSNFQGKQNTKVVVCSHFYTNLQKWLLFTGFGVFVLICLNFKADFVNRNLVFRTHNSLDRSLRFEELLEAKISSRIMGDHNWQDQPSSSAVFYSSKKKS